MQPITNFFKISKIFIPVLLGLMALVWLFYNDFNPHIFSSFHLSFQSVICIVLAFVLILLRDVSMMWRFRLFTDKLISWKQAFVVNTLSEFTTAVTPTVIGGSSLVVFFLTKEGVNAGRSTTIMLANLLLDELFFVVICPLLFLFIPLQAIFPSGMHLVSAFGYIFIGLYSLHLLWAIVLFIGIFVRPDWIKKILLLLFTFPLLKRWYHKVEVVTNHMLQASRHIKHRSITFWIKAGALTFFTWTVRFLVVNAIFLAFVSNFDHLIIFARQIILWIFMAVMPTPGGSGMSELAFKEYYGDLFPQEGVILLTAVIWRLFTYYFYLLLGILITPKWLKEAFTTNS